MRQIKFRAWDTILCEMYDLRGFAFDKRANGFGVIYFAEGGFKTFGPGEILLLEFTGLLDKNGVEIYNGDIMRTEGDMKEAIPVVKVTWQNGHFAAGGILGAGDYDGSDVVIIGNIHEHPELLEAK